MKQNKTVQYLYFSGLLLVPLVLVGLPADFFDNGQSICISVLLLDTECYGCGITRAVQHFLHFDFKTAWDYNHLVVIVFPILVYLWFQEVLSIYKKLKLNNKRKVDKF